MDIKLGQFGGLTARNLEKNTSVGSNEDGMNMLKLLGNVRFQEKPDLLVNARKEQGGLDMRY